tara:strand:+ start:163 stop:2871 length:2709 start_codon:yes stop_codon:yes gene_type:complete
MAMNTLKELVEAIKSRSKTIANTSTGTISGSNANDMVYLAKSVEALTGADALLQLFDEANEPAKVFDYSTSTNGVWTLGVDDISKPLIKLTQASTPSQSELTVVVPNRAFTVVIKNETTKNVFVQYSGETNNANKAKILPGKTGWVYGDYVASGTNKVQFVVDVEAITAALTTVTTTGGDMIYRQGAPSGTTFNIGVKVASYGGSNRFQFKFPNDDNYHFDGNMKLYPGKTYVFDVSDTTLQNHPLRFSATKNGTHASGTELLDFAPTDSTNDITYTGTQGQSSAVVTIAVPSNVTAISIYPYCGTHTGMGGDTQFDVTTATGEARLPLGSHGTALTVDGNSNIPKWGMVGNMAGRAYRLENDVTCRVADPDAPGYPGTENNGKTRNDFSLVSEVTDSANFPLHANKGIFLINDPRPQGGTYRGGGCVAEFADGSWKSPVIWGSSTNYSQMDPSNSNKVINMPGHYRDQSKGYDNFNKNTQNGNCIQTLRTYDSTYFLTDTGKVWAGGYNNVGQLGVGHTTSEYRCVPVQFPGAAGKIRYIAGPGSGNNNVTMLALDENGKVWGWGYNGHNQLDSSNTTNKTIPVEITGLSGKNVTAIQVIDAGYPTCYALTDAADGYKAYAWGYNGGNQCANGTTNNVGMGSPNVLEAGSGKKIVKMHASGAGSGGGIHLINEDGALYYGGYNNTGQAGDNNASGNKTSMTLVSTFNTATAGLKVLDVFSCHFTQGSCYATTDNGDFYMWGPNSNGATGTGTTSGSQNVPVKNSSVKWVSKVIDCFSVTSTSYYYMTPWLIAHDNEEDWKNKVNGTIYSCGANYASKALYGVGTGLVHSSWNPIPMPWGYQGKVRDISSHGYGQSSTWECGYMCLMMDGTIWGQGYNGAYSHGLSDTNTHWTLRRKTLIGG